MSAGAVAEAAPAGAVPVGLVKAFYFASFCYLATFMRYLTLYFESEGLGATDIGTLWSVNRIVLNGFTPLWGALADRTKKARTIMQVTLVIGVVPFLALAAPVGSGRSRFMPRAIALWVFGVCGSPRGALQDALARAACGQDADRWGKARVWGAIGWGLSHLVLGPLIDLLGSAVIFVTHVGATAVLFLVTRSAVPQACGEVKVDVTMQTVLGIFSRSRLFFFNMAMVGGGFSMVEGMLFLLLQEMKASTLLCGLSVGVTVVFELPIFQYSKILLERLGTRRMILLGQAAWVVRALFYSRMRNPWSVLLIEPLHGVTFALIWTAALQHVGDPSVSGHGLEASAQGLLSFCFMGVGPVIGLALGGFLFEHVGSHAVYAIFAVAIFASGVAFARWGEDAGALGGGKDKGKSPPTPLGRTVPMVDDESIIPGEAEEDAKHAEALQEQQG